MVKKLMAHLGADVEGVVGFGDGENDKEFLHSVGMGVAVANAAEVTQRAARLVSRWHHHEDAVARELQRLFPAVLGEAEA